MAQPALVDGCARLPWRRGQRCPVVGMGQSRAVDCGGGSAHARIRRFAALSCTASLLPHPAQAAGIRRSRRLSVLPVARHPRTRGPVVPVMRIAPRLCGVRAATARWTVRLSGVRACGVGPVEAVASLGSQPFPCLRSSGRTRPGGHRRGLVVRQAAVGEHAPSDSASCFRAANAREYTVPRGTPSISAMTSPGNSLT